jgi:hypothetical protein
MKTLIGLTLLAGFVCAPLSAQKLDLNFDAIAKKAKKKTEVQLDHPPQFTSVDTLSVHSYEFANAGDYADNDLDSLRKQVNSSAGWARFINVQEDGQHTEIYMLTQGGKPAGFLLIAGEAKQLTIVHVTGSIQLAQLEELVNSKLQFQGATPE